jgi:hypothetical protein
MDGVTGGIYSGDPGVDSWHLVSRLISSHLIPCYHTTIDTLHLSHLLISLALSEASCGSAQLRGSSQPGSIIPSHPLPTLLEPELLFLTNSFLDAARGAAECRRWTLCPLASPFHHSVNRASTERQQSVNRASTERQQSVNRVSTECQQFWVLHLVQSKGSSTADIHNHRIGSCSEQQ